VDVDCFRKRGKGASCALRRMKEQIERGELTITRGTEDGHTALEVALTKELGPIGGRIHLARSRNDQVKRVCGFGCACAFSIWRALGNCASAFVDFARTHSSALLPGYTHMRRAMPSNWGMWAAAFAEGLIEELEQLSALWSRIDRCPLGAAAGFGVPLRLNRERSAELLGFSCATQPDRCDEQPRRHEQAIRDMGCVRRR